MTTSRVQLLPSSVAEEAIDGLTALLRGRVPGDPGDRYFASDWSALWAELAHSGWTSIGDGPSPGTDGDLSFLELCSLAEAWGGFLVPLPLVPTLLARRWSLQRPPADTSLSYSLAEGVNSLIPFGEAAASVLARQGLIPRAEAGAASETDSWAPSLPISVCGRGGSAPGPVRLEAAVLAASEAVGAAATLLRRTVDYAKAREQFGRPIGSLQAIKHRLANLHCDLELARAGIAWCCSEGSATSEVIPAVLGRCLGIAEGCVQVHGGIGYTWEGGVHWYYRHVMAVRRVAMAAVSES